MEIHDPTPSVRVSSNWSFLHQHPAVEGSPSTKNRPQPPVSFESLIGVNVNHACTFDLCVRQDQRQRELDISDGTSVVEGLTSSP